MWWGAIADEQPATMDPLTMEGFHPWVMVTNMATTRDTTGVEHMVDTHEDGRGNHIEAITMVDLISVPTQDMEEVSILLAELYHVCKHQ
jgi:hypothetical protein